MRLTRSIRCHVQEILGGTGSLEAVTEFVKVITSDGMWYYELRTDQFPES